MEWISFEVRSLSWKWENCVRWRICLWWLHSRALPLFGSGISVKGRERENRRKGKHWLFSINCTVLGFHSHCRSYNLVLWSAGFYDYWSHMFVAVLFALSLCISLFQQSNITVQIHWLYFIGILSLYLISIGHKSKSEFNGWFWVHPSDKKFKHSNNVEKKEEELWLLIGFFLSVWIAWFWLFCKRVQLFFLGSTQLIVSAL